MKKALAFILILLIVAVPVLAEGWDFASMTTDELVQIRDAVIAELSTRSDSMNYTHMPEGVYLIGKDLDAGSYILFSATEYERTTYIFAYDDEGKVGSNDAIWAKNFDSQGQEMRIELSDGQYVSVEGRCGIDIRKAEKIIVP